MLSEQISNWATDAASDTAAIVKAKETSFIFDQLLVPPERAIQFVTAILQPFYIYRRSHDTFTVAKADHVIPKYAVQKQTELRTRSFPPIVAEHTYLPTITKYMCPGSTEEQ